MDTYGADFRNTMRMNVAVWSVQLSVGITLGSLQTNVSRVAKQIETTTCSKVRAAAPWEA